MEQIKTSFDFEKPIAELLQQIEKVKQVAEKTKVDMSATLTELEEKLGLVASSSSSTQRKRSWWKPENLLTAI